MIAITQPAMANKTSTTDTAMGVAELSVIRRSHCSNTVTIIISGSTGDVKLEGLRTKS